MLLKFFGSRNTIVPPNPNPSFREVVVGEKPLILQIIHAGGIVERYYMAVPATWIMEKYPKSVLARPEIFQRPWESIVMPEEILVPGEKYFVVPIRTVKKLRQRMWKPSIEMPNSLVCQPKDPSMLIGNRPVRFKGIESKTRNDSGVAEDSRMKISNVKGSRNKNVRFSLSLAIIDETRGSDDD